MRPWDRLASRFHGDPTSELRVVGVTGTNGKTTTAHLVRALLEAGGQRCGLLGTVESQVAGTCRPATRTTPEAIDLQADFRAMLDGGESCCAMEVSSHALALGRTDGVRFTAAVFTNLTQDHLDFHLTMEDYFQAKRQLFLPRRGGRSDPRSRLSTSTTPTGGAWPPSSSMSSRSRSTRTPTIAPAKFRWTWPARAFELHTPAGVRTLSLPLPGRFNVSNALGALAATHALGVELDTLVAALERGVRVPGRVEPVDEGQGFAVLVDYAHTPDSLQNVLSTAHEVGHGRVICVFRSRRRPRPRQAPLMGEIGARLADVLLVTSDNPRSEDPEAIIAEIMDGASRRFAPVRRRAGRGRGRSSRGDRAGRGAGESGDVLVIAGKGHEQGQELAGGVKVPFDDVTVAREALGARVG